MDAKIITPSPLAVQPGINLEIAFDVDPEAFPHGVELVLMKPGALDPIGKIQVKPGHMLAAMSLEVSAHLRAQFRKQIEAHLKKQAEAQAASGN
jgi:hypothetical protein